MTTRWRPGLQCKLCNSKVGRQKLLQHAEQCAFAEAQPAGSRSSLDLSEPTSKRQCGAESVTSSQSCEVLLLNVEADEGCYTKKVYNLIVAASRSATFGELDKLIQSNWMHDEHGHLASFAYTPAKALLMDPSEVGCLNLRALDEYQEKRHPKSRCLRAHDQLCTVLQQPGCSVQYTYDMGDSTRANVKLLCVKELSDAVKQAFQCSICGPLVVLIQNRHPEVPCGVCSQHAKYVRYNHVHNEREYFCTLACARKYRANQESSRRELWDEKRECMGEAWHPEGWRGQWEPDGPLYEFRNSPRTLCRGYGRVKAFD